MSNNWPQVLLPVKGCVMGSKVDACAECTRSCLLLHRTNLDPYSIVSSFFKIMFGKNSLQELIVPPKFARTLSDVKDTYIEDSTGQKWKVQLSIVKGSLTIKKGWHEFSTDHGIKMGDLVVFHYLKNSHFIVQIFTTTGCERPMIFNDKNYQNKRIKATSDFTATTSLNGTPSDPDSLPKDCSDSCRVAELEPEPEPVVDEIRKQGKRKPHVENEDVMSEENISKRPKMTTAEDFLLESCVKTGSSMNICKEVDRDYLWDLSTFEMPLNRVDNTASSIIPLEKGCLRLVDDLQTVQNEMDSVIEVLEECPIAEENSFSLTNEPCLPLQESCPSPEIDIDIDMPLKFIMPQKVPSVSENSQLSGETAKAPKTVKKEPKSCQEVNVSHIVSSNDVKLSNCKEIVIYNGDVGNSIDEMASDKGIQMNEVDEEAVVFCDSKPAAVMKMIKCYVQQDTEPFLELPERLPVKINRQRSILAKKLVFLRDPGVSDGKLSPVLYLEGSGMKVLTNGWKEFRRSNSIRPGDQCTFVLENMEDSIFQVEILRS